MTDTLGIKTLERHGGNALRPGTSWTREEGWGAKSMGHRDRPFRALLNRSRATVPLLTQPLGVVFPKSPEDGAKSSRGSEGERVLHPMILP